MTHNPFSNGVEYKNTNGRSQIAIAQGLQEIFSHRVVDGGRLKIVGGDKEVASHEFTETVCAEGTGY